jgi:cytochrome c oxidase assembly protein subunit 15
VRAVPGDAADEVPIRHDRVRHLFARLVVAATLFLIFAGGLVTSTGSGLAVPDWPLSYGMLMPPMIGGIFYEHGHRLVASGVGLLTLCLALWTALREPRRGVRRLAWGALAAVLAQGILGGLTVLFLLPTPVSVAHACLAQLFLCLVVSLAYVTSREWAEAPASAEDGGALRSAALLATGVVFVQLLAGAVMRHTGAGLAIPDFPLAFGRIVPPFESPGVAVHFVHRVGALVVLGFVVHLFLVSRASADERCQRPGRFALLLVLLQILLGAATVLTRKATYPATLHVVTGAALLATCWFASLRAHRLLPVRGPQRVSLLAAAGAPR